jgi:hypothetical protein
MFVTLQVSKSDEAASSAMNMPIAKSPLMEQLDAWDPLCV